MTDLLTIDGSYGEGGGQILRTALSLSAITLRPFFMVNIRAGRRNPGLQPQHLAAARAAGIVSRAVVTGAQLGSQELSFLPQHTPTPGHYGFDVSESVPRGSAGSVTLILQTILLPLAFANGTSRVVLRGGTHVEWSPPFDDLVSSYFPALRRIGFSVDAELVRWGWYPVGDGEISCRIGAVHRDGAPRVQPIDALERGNLRRITGRAVAANLPAHIPQRMVERARSQLTNLGAPADIQAECVTAACPGAAIFLTAHYDAMPAAFSAYGRLGKPAEAVAEAAVTALIEHHRSDAAIEAHLADQLLLPLAFASGTSGFTVARVTPHLTTNAWAISQFGLAEISFEMGTPCRVRVEPHPLRVAQSIQSGLSRR